MKFFKNYADKMQTNSFEGEDFELFDERCESEKETTSGYTSSRIVRTYESNLENTIREL